MYTFKWISSLLFEIYNKRRTICFLFTISSIIKPPTLLLTLNKAAYINIKNVAFKYEHYLSRALLHRIITIIIPPSRQKYD